MGYISFQDQSGTGSYANAFETAQQNLGAVPTDHQPSDASYRKQRSWGDWWRELVRGSYGIDRQVAFDPLVGLQNQLEASYDPAQINNLFSNSPGQFGQAIGARNLALGRALRQQAAQMGVHGAFSGVEDVATRARNALSEQALAAYQPQAWQAQQQAQQQIEQLLQAMATADIEQEAVIAAAGRNVE